MMYGRSISGMMRLTLFLTVSFSVLCRPSYLAAAFLQSAVLSALTFAVLNAVYRRGATRAYWTGFAVVGWLYVTTHQAPGFAELVGRHSLATFFADLIYSAIGPESPLQTGRHITVFSSGLPDLSSAWFTWNGWKNRLDHIEKICPLAYTQIVHCLIGFVVAYVGGFVAKRLHARPDGGKGRTTTP